MDSGGEPMDRGPPTLDPLAGATGAWVWDLKAKRLYGDARFATLLGLDATETAAGLRQDAFFQRAHPNDRMRLRIALAGVTHGAEMFAKDFRLSADDGVRWLSARGRAEHSTDGGPPSFAGVLIDITEQKRLEERLRIAQSAGGIGTFEYVEGFGTATVSDQFCRLLGLHEADALPVRTINGVVHPEDPSLIGQNGPIGDVETVETELRIRRADTGEQRWIALRGERRPDGEYAGVTFIGVIYDISSAKSAEAQLQELAQTLEARVEERTQERDRLWTTSRDLFAVLDPAGVFLSVNPAWKTVLGYEESDVLKHGFRDFAHLDDTDAGVARWNERGRPTVLEFDTRVRAKDGEWRWVSWTINAFADAYYAVGRNVTERRALEDQLRQSQKMEAVGQLTGGIAHDFNNMLTGVIGGLDMVERRLSEGRVPDAGRFLTAARTSAHRAAALTHRLLAFSRRQTLDPQNVDVNRLVGSMEDMVRRTLGEKVDLAVTLAPDLWPTLTDANQLESAILNLAINARDAMPDGGKLTIETNNTRLETAFANRIEGLEPGEYVVACVSDTGAGMPPEVLARAFDPFFTTKPLGQGTGLGLSMVYGFARQSGGHVTIYSEPGVGTTVQLYLPRLTTPSEAEAPALPAKDTAPEGAGEKVLVVEDDAAVRMLIVEVLRELGYTALEVDRAERALEILDSARPIDLLVSDVGLPGLNGRQLAEIAREKRPNLPILFITGYAAGAAKRSEFLDSGMEMITKPFAIDALALKIREMIAR